MNSTRVIGPSIAGVFIGVAFLGVGGVYVMTTLGFIIAGLNMLRLPSGTPIKKAQPTSAMTDMVDGLKYLRSKPGVMLLIAVSFATVMMGFPYQSFLPSLTESVFHDGAAQLGLLPSAGASGGVPPPSRVAPWANALAPTRASRISHRLSRFKAYNDQLVDLPNSPSLTISTPACAWRLTTSATESESSLL